MAKKAKTMSDRLPIAPDPLFFLDYDGTLAPIVDDPMQAFPHPDVPELMEALARRYPVWIISGRHLSDLEQLIDQSVDAIGLHGIQHGRLHGPTSFRISDEERAAILSMRRSAPISEGIQIEEKGPMFAVHYRLSGDKDAARRLISEWAEATPDSLDAIWGKDVVELRPKRTSKGTAILDVIDGFPGRTPIYIGDDVTDEDAFRVLDADAITIKVGPGETAAKYRLGDVNDVVDYLRGYLSDPSDL